MKKMRHFTKAALAFLMLTILMFFAAGCSDNPGNVPTKDNDGIDVPNNPPSVSGGSLGEDPIANEAMKNLPDAPVTRQNLETEFIPELIAALQILNEYSSARTARNTRSLPDEYEKNKESANRNFTEYGSFSGRIETVSKSEYDWHWSEISDLKVSGYESGAFKYFDFSNSGTLFLGGNLGVLWTPGDGSDIENGIYHSIVKSNGSIEFRGNFAGKIVFDNFVYSEKVQEDCGYYGCVETILEMKPTGGSFYVESNGAKVNLLLDLINEFFMYSGSIDYGDTPINITMPAVPAAPNGKLTERSGGNTVNANNINSFIAAFKAEFVYSMPRSTRSINENKQEWEHLVHGENSGYYIRKGTDKEQSNNSGTYNTFTGAMEYSDYSNLGRLYFGGGYGRAGFYKTDYTNYTYTEVKLNGKINFNGEFKGTLDLQNFSYRYNRSNNTYTHIGGKAVIGSLDVTDDYMRYIVRGEYLPDPNPDPIIPGLVGTWEREFYGWGIGYVFRTDGTGVYYWWSSNESGDDEFTYTQSVNVATVTFVDVEEAVFDFVGGNNANIFDDDIYTRTNGSGNSIVGTWEHTNEWGGEVVVFNANGSGTISGSDYQYNFTYTQSGTTVTLLVTIIEKLSFVGNLLTNNLGYTYTKISDTYTRSVGKNSRAVSENKSPRLKERFLKRR
jgi:hypothetical protein